MGLSASSHEEEVPARATFYYASFGEDLVWQAFAEFDTANLTLVDVAKNPTAAALDEVHEFPSLVCISSAGDRAVYQDLDVMTRSELAWADALVAVREPGSPTDEDVARLFDGLTRWRHHRVYWRPTGARATGRASAHFLVEAISRMVLMDYIHGSEAAEPRLVAAAGVCRTTLAQCEREALAMPFTPTEDVLGIIRGVTESWRDPGSAERERGALAPVAHAIIVSDAAVPSETLASAQRLSTICAAREYLRHVVSSAVDEQAPDALAPRPSAQESVAGWLIRRWGAEHSEAASRGFSDAVAADMLDPLALPLEEARGSMSAIGLKTAVAALLTTQSPAVASRAAEAARAPDLGDGTGRTGVLLSLAVFHHAAHQALGVSWADAYTATDARPEAAYDRLHRYLQDRMISPPPLLLVVDQAVYAVSRERDGRFGRVTRHECGFGAIAEWVLAARAHPALGRRYGTVIKDALESHGKLSEEPPTMQLISL